MDFELSDVHRSWRDKGRTLGLDIGPDAAAAAVIQGAARVGLLDPAADLISASTAIEALAQESPAAAIVLALHSGTALSVAGDDRFTSLFRGDAVAAVGLSSDDMPTEEDGRLFGRAPWVAPLTDHGIAVVSPGVEGERIAYAVALDAGGLTIEAVHTAALAGIACGHLTFTGAAGTAIGPTLPIMIRIRILMAAAGLGMGRRALHEALTAAKRARTVAAGEQTVQGLLADAATELDAAEVMTWKAASPSQPVLADASMAKLMATAAAQRAVERATQVVGADSFQRGHIIERLAQDVRALELFAGRTEALRAAVAEDVLPR